MDKCSRSTLVKFLVVVAVSLGYTNLGLASQSNFTVCFSPGGNCDQKLVNFSKAAHATLDIAIYSVTLPDLVETISALNQAGIKVRMVVDRKEAHSPSSLVPKLVQAGIPLKFGSARGIMHDKFTIVDHKMIETGSFNYSGAATNANAENQIYLDAVDVVAKYQEQFETLWNTGLPINSN